MENFEEQLKSAKLKTYKGPVKDFSNPKLAGFLTERDVQEYQNHVLDCNVEAWYETIKDLTFKTEFCSISEKDAKLFVDVYERIFRNKDSSEIGRIEWRKLLKEEEVDLLKCLESKIENSLQDYVINGFAFVKTSSRSAKDAPLVSNNFEILYHQYLNKYEENEQNLENNQITCLLKAAFDCLRIKNAHEVIEMFIKSERIYQDMLLALSNKERFRENFVIRKFVDIEVDMEFRGINTCKNIKTISNVIIIINLGFVYDGNLNALSQYNFLMYSENLVKNKLVVQDLILKFFNDKVTQILSKSGFSKHYVIDFAVFSSTSGLYLLSII
jgi:hypothetical protein